MKELRKNYILSFLVIAIMFGSSFSLADASTFGVSPVSFIKRTTNIVLGRVSDIIYYLVMQKKYIFDHFQDPNIYSSLEIPEVVEQVIASSTVVLSTTTDEESPVSVTTSTPPQIIQTSVSTKPPAQAQVTPTVPVLIIQPEPEPEPEPNVPEEIPDLEGTWSEILDFTNKERRAKSLNPLTSDYILDGIASQRADDLFLNQYFEHESPDGKSAPDLAKEMHYDYLLIGENLALGNFDDSQAIVTAWMDSPGHRANILKPEYQELGVAVKEGMFEGRQVTIAVQIFGKPMSNCPKPNPVTKNLIDMSTVAVEKMQVEAQTLYDDLKLLGENPGLDRGYYNQKIQEYNYSARKINDAVIALKSIIDFYNTEVSRYNACIK